MSGPSSRKTSETIGPIRTARTSMTAGPAGTTSTGSVRYNSMPGVLGRHIPRPLREMRERERERIMREKEIEEMNTIISKQLTDEEENVYNMLLDAGSQEDGSQGDGSQMEESMGADALSHATTTESDLKLVGTAGVLGEYYIELMRKLHSYFNYVKVHELNELIEHMYKYDNYEITVDINDRERFVLKFFHEYIEKFHFSVFTRGGVYRGLHITNPTTKKHMYIGHTYFENSLHRGRDADIHFFSKSLITIGYYIETGKSVKDPTESANSDIIDFINKLSLSPKEHEDFAKILKLIGRNYRRLVERRRAGGVLNSYKSKELKINMIKNKIKLLKKDKIKNKEKIIKQNKIIEDIKNKIKIEKEKAKLKNKQKNLITKPNVSKATTTKSKKQTNK